LKNYAKLVEYWNKFRAVAPVLAAPVPLANVFLQMEDQTEVEIFIKYLIFSKISYRKDSSYSLYFIHIRIGRISFIAVGN
jgi:hypothetical protein